MKHQLTLTQFLSTPAAYPIESVLRSSQHLVNGLIDYISIMPDPFTMNQLQCYLFPQTAVEVLCSTNIYQIITHKIDRVNPKTKQVQPYYPYLDRLFQNIKKDPNLGDILLGYICKVLLGLAKKTPEIYEYFKQNTQFIELILNSNKLLIALQQFIIMFLCESTMQLYVFLKTSLIRMLLSKIIEGDTSYIVLSLLDKIYKQLIQRQKLIKEDKEQLVIIRKSFEEQDFINLLMFKISSKNIQSSYYIAKILNSIVSQIPTIILAFDKTYFSHLEDYFEEYQDSSDFMIIITRSHLEVLKLMIKILIANTSQPQHTHKLLKRLLVYSSVHENVTLLQTLLFTLVNYLIQSNNNISILKSVNIIAFLKKCQQKSNKKYGIKSALKRICKLFYETQQLIKTISQQQKSIINQTIMQNKLKCNGIKYFSSYSNHKNQIISQNNSKQQKEKTQQIQNQSVKNAQLYSK